MTKPQELAKTQNEFFLDKITRIRDNLPPAVIDPLGKLINLMAGRICSFSLSAAHPDSVDKFMSDLSTTALIQMYDEWVTAYDDGELSGVCLLDMSAAFDIVDHSILLKKLELYGFEKNSLDWIQSYLRGRSQCVSINGSLSKLLLNPGGKLVGG